MDESIYFLPAAGTHPRLLINHSPSIGSSPNDDFMPTSDRFKPGDICFIHSFSHNINNPDKKKEIEEKTIEIIKENKFSSSSFSCKNCHSTLFQMRPPILHRISLYLFITHNQYVNYISFISDRR